LRTKSVTEDEQIQAPSIPHLVRASISAISPFTVVLTMVKTIEITMLSFIVCQCRPRWVERRTSRAHYTYRCHTNITPEKGPQHTVRYLALYAPPFNRATPPNEKPSASLCDYPDDKRNSCTSFITTSHYETVETWCIQRCRCL